MTIKDLKIWWTLIYVASIVIVNYTFSVLPMLPLGEGIVIPSATFLVGLIFVFRDFAQREVGHYVIPAMLIAGALSYVLADPTIAIASVTAFIVSEFADWAVYSFTGRSFPQRVLLSSALATPIDSALFLYMIGFFSVSGVIVMTLVKMVGALAVWWMIRKRMG